MSTGFHKTSFLLWFYRLSPKLKLMFLKKSFKQNWHIWLWNCAFNSHCGILCFFFIQFLFCVLGDRKKKEFVKTKSYSEERGGGMFHKCIPYLLAYLSHRLTRWTYSMPIVCRPCVHTLKLEYLWGKLASLDQILWVALGWGKGCIRFLHRLDQNSGYHSNQ